MNPQTPRAEKIIESHRLAPTPELYAIGSFDDRVTVLTQQRRALNLAWALIETGRLPTDASAERCRVAVLGGGFAGLSFAAALVHKQCNCSITLFEERDTLLPLQQGSDTRWLHPHIYDWPAEGSEAVAAMLPVLNWTAARASDVVVQVLASWSDLLEAHQEPRSIGLWCNTRHLQLRDTAGAAARLEWVGERRDPATGRARDRQRNAEGRSAEFDLVVLAVGFGLEAFGSSYWRNEVLGQPGLEQRRTTYLVSGRGDGAMIDLLRLKISQFRQDRILAELFGGKEALISELRTLRMRFLTDEPFSLYEAFDLLMRRKSGDIVRKQMVGALNALAKRLRRDCDVVLRLRPEMRNIADLLDTGKLKSSFQNALLLYLLYRCGGFAPASGELDVIAERFKVADPCIVRRHGTERLNQFERLLPERLYRPIADAWKKDRCLVFRQSAEIEWSGGYFGTRGRAAEYADLTDEERATSRKEYLPGPTGLLAAAIAGAASGHLLASRPGTTHLRVTVHRVLTIHDEDLLQQACDYLGTGPADPKGTAGRTFPANIATIGLAYRTRSIVRTKHKITKRELDTAMRELKLNTASRNMAQGVQFVAALPILQPENSYYAPSPVCAVLYFDSRDSAFDLDDAAFAELAGVVTRTIEAARLACEGTLDRLDNTPLRTIEASAPSPEPLPIEVADKMELVDTPPPSVATAFGLNIDHSDLTPIAR